MQLCLSQELGEWFEEIKTTLEPFKDAKICVVTLIGKSPLGNVFAKTDPINDILERQVFPNAWSLKKKTSSEIHVYFDSDTKTLFLHLLSHHDLNLGVEDLMAPENESEESKGFFKRMAELEESFVQSLLFLFHLSHIVLLIEPCGRFDLTHSRLLRSLNSLREYCHDDVSDILGGIPSVSTNWARHSRFCSPRLLFGFHRSPIRHDLGNMKKKELLEKLQICIEDQIYYMFRRSRVITDDSSRSIGAVPPSDHFVHVFGPGEAVKDPLRDLLSLMHGMASTPLNPTPSSSKDSESGSHHEERRRPTKDRFWDFLMTHVYEAHDNGFNDNEGKHPIESYFERPKLGTFIVAAQKLHSYFIAEPNSQLRSKISRITNPELNFSESRCRKAFPLAMDVYQSGLPEYYPYITHEAKVKQAVEYMKGMARGPELESSLENLRRECDQFWANGRKSCESLSLTGNNCVNPVHKLSRIKSASGKLATENNEGDEENRPILQHRSKARYLSTCNCGQKQLLRDDPFRLIEANYEFFNRVEFSCCAALEKYPFPLYQTVGRANLDDTGTSLEETQTVESPIKAIAPESAMPPPGGILIRGIHEALASAATHTQSQDDQVKSTGGGSTGLEFNVDRDNRLMISTKETTTCGTVDSDAMSPAAAAGDKQAPVEKSAPSGNDDPKTQDDEEPESEFSSDPLESTEDDDVVGPEAIEEEINEELENSGAGELDPDYLEEESAPTDTNISDISVPEAEITKESTEYDEMDESFLNYMPHSQAPFGALPVFPSWSVLCLGSSSIYTHAIGLRDKPNFSHGSLFLLPWDLNLKVDLERWHSRMEEILADRPNLPGRGQKNPIKPRLTTGEGKVHVKIFVGFEFECPRGHRFMLQSPEKMLKYPGPGGPKDISADSLIKSDVPLWFPCSCRSTPPMTGQLMRIHVVTPKAPILVTMNPKIQPDPRCPIFFFPGAQGRIQLTSAKYYIMRLPYTYMGPKGPFYPPKEPAQIGRILKDSLSVAPEWDE